jgi:hypothetical protein
LKAPSLGLPPNSIFLFFFAVALVHTVVAVADEKDKNRNSKQLQLVPLGEHPSYKSNSSLILKTDEDEELQGFLGIAKNYGPKLAAAFGTHFPAKATWINTKFNTLKEWSPMVGGTVTRFNALVTKYKAQSAGVKLVTSVGFAIADAGVSCLIVMLFPPAAGILWADAAVELAKAVYDLGGGETDTNAQTARIAWQGVNLVLAIGGLSGTDVPGAVPSDLAKAMGSFWYGFASNAAGEFSDGMGQNLAADVKAAKETERNNALRAKIPAGVQTCGTKKRKIEFGGNPNDGAFNTAYNAVKNSF